MVKTKLNKKYYVGRNKKLELYCTKCHSKKISFVSGLHAFICSRCETINSTWDY